MKQFNDRTGSDLQESACPESDAIHTVTSILSSPGTVPVAPGSAGTGPIVPGNDGTVPVEPGGAGSVPIAPGNGGILPAEPRSLQVVSAILLAFVLSSSVPVSGQNPTTAEMERWLDSASTPGSWPAAQTPQASFPQATPLRSPTMPAGPAQGGPLNNLMRNFGAPSAPGPVQQPGSRAGAAPRFNRQELLRSLFGGQSAGVAGGGGGSYVDPNAVYRAQDQLQLARSYAAQAESAASRAQYGDKDSRYGAAAEAQNYANAARAAADRANASAASGTPEAQSAASEAYAHASRAQGAANRAAAAANGALW